MGYEQAFGRFQAAGGYRPTFNVWAFFFGALWYFDKGMTTKALALFATKLAIAAFVRPESPSVAFVLALLVALYAGFAATWDLYNHVKAQDAAR